MKPWLANTKWAICPHCRGQFSHVGCMVCGSRGIVSKELAAAYLLRFDNGNPDRLPPHPNLIKRFLREFNSVSDHEIDEITDG